MNRLIAAVGLTILIVVAACAVWLMRSDGPGPKAPPRALDAAAKLPLLPGADADEITSLVLEQLKECQADVPGRQCQRTSDLRFRITVRSGLARIEALHFEGAGLIPEVDACFRTALERLRVSDRKTDGQVEVLFPVFCDSSGHLRVLKPSRAESSRQDTPPSSAAPDPKKAQGQK